MAFQSFDCFSDLEPAIRVQIWQEAVRQEGPRIVEITECRRNHTRREQGKCFVATHQYFFRAVSDCCFHVKNPLKDPDAKPCRCTESHQYASPGPMLCCVHRWEEDPLEESRECEACLMMDAKRKIYNIYGHGTEGQRHMCHRPNSKSSSPLLRTCSESRYEFQRLGVLRIPLSALDKRGREGPRPHQMAWVNPIYLNFEVDSLAISCEHFRYMIEFKDKIEGMGQVNSLILRSPSRTCTGRVSIDVGSVSRILDYFPNLETLNVVLRESQSIRYNGQPKLCGLAQVVQHSELSVYETGFATMMELVSWLRDKKGMKPVKSQLVGLQRTEGPEVRWCSGNIDTASHEDYSNFWRGGGFRIEGYSFERLFDKFTEIMGPSAEIQRAAVKEELMDVKWGKRYAVFDESDEDIWGEDDD